MFQYSIGGSIQIFSYPLLAKLKAIWYRFLKVWKILTKNGFKTSFFISLSSQTESDMVPFLKMWKIWDIKESFYGHLWFRFFTLLKNGTILLSFWLEGDIKRELLWPFLVQIFHTLKNGTIWLLVCLEGDVKNEHNRTPGKIWDFGPTFMAIFGSDDLHFLKKVLYGFQFG